MQKNRLEAFSDGVLAIVITIMVLELKVPRSVDIAALTPLLPVFLSYLLSFVYLGIYWKGRLSLLLDFIAIPLAVVSPWTSIGLYVFVALVWFIPDRRIERVLEKRGD